MNDLRVPTGFFFAAIGVLLLIYAAISPNARAPFTQTNINLWSGLTFVLFGGILLWLSRRAN
jgi:hypothetical protein